MLWGDLWNFISVPRGTTIHSNKFPFRGRRGFSSGVQSGLVWWGNFFLSFWWARLQWFQATNRRWWVRMPLGNCCSHQWDSLFPGQVLWLHQLTSSTYSVSWYRLVSGNQEKATNRFHLSCLGRLLYGEPRVQDSRSELLFKTPETYLYSVFSSCSSEYSLCYIWLDHKLNSSYRIVTETYFEFPGNGIISSFGNGVAMAILSPKKFPRGDLSTFVLHVPSLA